MRSLIVDDEFIALNRLIALLRPYGACDAATHARQAVQMFRTAIDESNRYDLVTIDIDMPEIAGVDLLRMLRSREQWLNIHPTKIIMVTGSGSYRNVCQLINARCDDFIVKPVDRKLLHAKLETLGLIPPDSPMPTSAEPAAGTQK